MNFSHIFITRPVATTLLMIAILLAGALAYRQTVLTSFQEVEDSLSALGILEDEAGIQKEAFKAAEKTLEAATNQYRAGTVAYLNVVVAQLQALEDEKTVVAIQGRRMLAAVMRVKAMGDGWKSEPLTQ